MSPLQDCLEVAHTIYRFCPDLTDTLCAQCDQVLCTDGSSFIKDGVWHGGPAVVNKHKVICARELDHETSAHRVKLIIAFT